MVVVLLQVWQSEDSGATFVKIFESEDSTDVTAVYTHAGNDTVIFVTEAGAMIYTWAGRFIVQT